MWPAATLTQVLDRTRAAADFSDPFGERLVTLLFAPRDAGIWRELKFTRADLDEIAGPSWDLFFIGVPMVSRRDTSHGGDWSKHFDARAFKEAAEQVTREHVRALKRARLDESGTWRYHGGTEAVSFLYRQGGPDWASLTACSLGSGSDVPGTLTELTWRQKHWREAAREDPIFWKNPHQVVANSELGELQMGLIKSGGDVLKGAAGSAAFELVKTLAGF